MADHTVQMDLQSASRRLTGSDPDMPQSVGLRADGRPGPFFAAAMLSGVARARARNRFVAAAVAQRRQQSALALHELPAVISTNWEVIGAGLRIGGDILP